MFSTTTIEATVGTEPSLRFTPQGIPVCSFRAVCNDRKRAADGTWVDGDPTWLDITVWRSHAENAAESLAVGDRVIAVGRIRTEDWTDQQGQTRTSLKMTADHLAVSLLFNPARPERRPRATPAPPPSRPAQPAPQRPAAPAEPWPPQWEGRDGPPGPQHAPQQPQQPQQPIQPAEYSPTGPVPF